MVPSQCCHRRLHREHARKGAREQAIYKDITQLEEMCRRMPMLKAAKELEYGFMILDKANPSSMFKPSSDEVYVIPPEEETKMPAQKAAEGFQNAADKVKDLLGGV